MSAPYQLELLPLLIPPHMFVLKSFSEDNDGLCRHCERPLFASPNVHPFGAPQILGHVRLTAPLEAQALSEGER